MPRKHPTSCFLLSWRHASHTVWLPLTLRQSFGFRYTAITGCPPSYNLLLPLPAYRHDRHVHPLPTSYRHLRGLPDQSRLAHRCDHRCRICPLGCLSRRKLAQAREDRECSGEHAGGAGGAIDGVGDQWLSEVCLGGRAAWSVEDVDGALRFTAVEPVTRYLTKAWASATRSGSCRCRKWDGMLARPDVGWP